MKIKVTVEVEVEFEMPQIQLTDTPKTEEEILAEYANALASDPSQVMYLLEEKEWNVKVEKVK